MSGAYDPSVYSMNIADAVTASGMNRQVWAGKAYKTRGGNTKDNLMKNKHGKIVSKKRHLQGIKSKHNLVPLDREGMRQLRAKRGQKKRNQEQEETPVDEVVQENLDPVESSQRS